MLFIVMMNTLRIFKWDAVHVCCYMVEVSPFSVSALRFSFDFDLVTGPDEF